MRNHTILRVGEDISEMIIFSKTHGRQIVLVDSDELDRLARWRWFVNWMKCSVPARFYVATHTPWTNMLLMHRFIMRAPTGNRKIVVDHIDGNTLDNRKSNLRITSQSENSKNRHPL